jgi:hypothetical protein
MITETNFIELACSFDGVEMKPHFNRTGFRVIGKRMFATYLAENNTANIFLTPKEQAIFCEMDHINIFPVPNKWGENGATTFRLSFVSREILQEALLSAYSAVAGKAI